MNRTKRSTRKFKSRKQNNHRQKKTTHIKYRKHGKIGERNKSKRKSRKIFLGGGATREQQDQHHLRFQYIYDFMKLLKVNNLLINCRRLESRSLESPFKELVCSDTWHDIFRSDIINKTLNLKKFGYLKFPLYENTNYYKVIKTLSSIIDNEKMIKVISNNSIFNEIMTSHNIHYSNEIAFFNNFPIIYKHEKDKYMYILRIDDIQNIYKMELPQAQPPAEEEAAAKQAQEEAAEEEAAKQAAEEAKAKARLKQLNKQKMAAAARIKAAPAKQAEKQEQTGEEQTGQ